MFNVTGLDHRIAHRIHVYHCELPSALVVKYIRWLEIAVLLERVTGMKFSEEAAHFVEKLHELRSLSSRPLGRDDNI